MPIIINAFRSTQSISLALEVENLDDLSKNLYNQSINMFDYQAIYGRDNRDDYSGIWIVIHRELAGKTDLPLAI